MAPFTFEILFLPFEMDMDLMKKKKLSVQFIENLAIFVLNSCFESFGLDKNLVQLAVAFYILVVIGVFLLVGKKHESVGCPRHR